jgi:ABC-type tungstate transport system substrate-binding protein
MTDPKVFSIAPRLIKNTQEQLRVHTSHKAISIVRSKRITFFFDKTKFKSRVFLRQTWSNKLSNSNFQAILHKLSKRSPRDNALLLTNTTALFILPNAVVSTKRFIAVVMKPVQSTAHAANRKFGSMNIIGSPYDSVPSDPIHPSDSDHTIAKKTPIYT